MNPRAAVAAGDRYGRMVVLSEAEKISGQRRVLCRCDCGSQKVVFLGHLRRGRTRSCGCLHNEQLSASRRKPGRRPHGRMGETQRTPEYLAWCNIIQRCTPGRSRSKNYGDRGIRICARWRQSFDAFLADMGSRPAGTSIDRIDNDGDYEPSNCRWATRAEQNRNRRTTRKLHFNGSEKPIGEWAADFNLPHHVLRDRLNSGWPPEKALTEPVR